MGLCNTVKMLMFPSWNMYKNTMFQAFGFKQNLHLVHSAVLNVQSWKDNGFIV